MAAESAKTRKTRNIIMVAVIAVLAVCAVLLVGNLQGWFGGGSGAMTAKNKVGTVNVIRSDISYALDDGAEVRASDTVETLSGASITVGYSNGGSLRIDSSTQVGMTVADADIQRIAQPFDIEIPSAADDGSSSHLELIAGQMVASLPSSSFALCAGDSIVTGNNAVVTASLQSGALNVGVLAGNVTVNGQPVEAGNNALVLSGQLSTSVLAASSYDDYILGALADISSSQKLCFASDDLSKLVADRADQKKLAQQQAAGSASGGGDKSCTLEIRCDTVLSNMGSLAADKTAYVPSDGEILPVTQMGFADGETVYDVLSRACEGASVQLEASWSPLYNAYYIEGIGNLYEFDCGSGSGWTYKVNGWVPNYGVSGYKLLDGDVVQLLYTCDYGNDV